MLLTVGTSCFLSRSTDVGEHVNFPYIFFGFVTIVRRATTNLQSALASTRQALSNGRVYAVSFLLESFLPVNPDAGVIVHANLVSLHVLDRPNDSTITKGCRDMFARHFKYTCENQDEVGP